MVKNNKEISFQEVIEELLDNSKIFSPIHLRRFSDMNQVDLDALKIAWPQIDPNRRANLLEDLEELSVADTLTCFDDLCFMILDDEDPRVRATALRLLWETNQLSFSDRLTEILRKDNDATVRSIAASNLGKFVYLGELDEISSRQLKRIEEALLNVLAGDEKRIVKRRSLESLGFSSRPEVRALIQKAYGSEDIEWRASALLAMGRSADKRWKDQILIALHDPEPEIRFEAVRAAGELELKSSRQPILEMLSEPENRMDEDMLQAIVWSLSQIGGENVREVMVVLLEQAEDAEEEEFIASALENLEFTEGMDVLGMLEIDLDDEEQDIDLFDQFYDDEDDDLE